MLGNNSALLGTSNPTVLAFIVCLNVSCGQFLVIWVKPVFGAKLEKATPVTDVCKG